MFEPTFDDLSKVAVQEMDPAGQLGWLLDDLDVDLRFSGWLPTESSAKPGESRRRNDLMALFVSASGTQLPWAIAIEIQAQEQRLSLARLVEYSLRNLRELRHGPHGRDTYQVMAAAINLTDRWMNDTLSMEPPGKSGRGEVDPTTTRREVAWHVSGHSGSIVAIYCSPCRH